MSTVWERMATASGAGWGWRTVALGVVIFLVSFPLWH